MVAINERQIMEYGKSMYGGWYANFYDNKIKKYDGIHTETLNELCAKLHISKTALKRDVARIDN